MQQDHQGRRRLRRLVVPQQGLDPLRVHRLVATNPALRDGLDGHVAHHAGVRRVAATLAVDVEGDRGVVVRLGLERETHQVDT